MIKLNKKEYLDKLHACWIGKNIGGTLGAPYEGKQEFVDVKGFVTEPGEPLPNDDLDLQLVWLCALEEQGVHNFGTTTLAEYWVDWISPHWNEYGIAKRNLQMGILPPMSGEVDNEKWKTSNGAWIRSEIWAGLAPGLPDIAVKYATMDAMVDHGTSEGSCAEIFTAALQSYAYIRSDVRELINAALKKIPEDSMTSRTVRLVMECYDKGLDYKEAREKVIELNKSLGWFQAPGNLGFVTIGLIYGEGDFKKSMLYAVSCGDDTDCTAATVGATLGIVGGTAGIPDDWKKQVGDRIYTVSINGSYAYRMPKTCTALTDRVLALVPDVMKANRVKFEFTDGESEYGEKDLKKYTKLTSKELLDRMPYSYDIKPSNLFSVRVELDNSPRVKAGDKRLVTLTFTSAKRNAVPRMLYIKLITPDNLTVENYEKTLALEYPQPEHGIWGVSKTSFEVTVGERLETVDRLYAEITCTTIPYPVIVPVVFLGR